jgi:hypothetical protein
MPLFARQVAALLDNLELETAVVGDTSRSPLQNDFAQSVALPDDAACYGRTIAL